jgi:hypothetical protein
MKQVHDFKVFSVFLADFDSFLLEVLLEFGIVYLEHVSDLSRGKRESKELCNHAKLLRILR